MAALEEWLRCMMGIKQSGTVHEEMCMRAKLIRWKPLGIREVTHEGMGKGKRDYKIKQEVRRQNFTAARRQLTSGTSSTKPQSDSGLLNQLSCHTAAPAHLQDHREKRRTCGVTSPAAAALGCLLKQELSCRPHNLTPARSLVNICSSELVFFHLSSHFSVLRWKKWSPSHRDTFC